MKKRILGLSMLAFCLTVAGVIVGVTASPASAVFRPCNPFIQCLDVWNPVICSNGVVYSNQCYANRACATGCVAY